MFASFYLARRYFLRGRAKHISFISVISCLGVSLGVFALIVVMSVMNGFDNDLMDRLLKFNYHLTVETPERELLPAVKERIDKIKGVENSSVILQTQVFAKVDRYIVPLMVKGIDFNDEAEAKNFFQYVKKDLKNAGFFAGEGLYDRLGLSDTLEYYPLDKNFKLKEENLRGFFRMGIYDIDNNYLITDLEKAKNLSPNYYMFLGVRIKNPMEAKKIRSIILQEFPRGLSVNTWMDNQALLSALKLEKLTMFVLLSLIALVASFNIFATLMVKVVEKTKDIGVLKALGFTSGKILAIFSLQGVFLGVIGVFLGTTSGLGLCLFMQKYHFVKIPVDIYSIEYLPVFINYRDIFVIAVLGLLFSFISSLFPAIRASRLSPCEALRYE
ncbi:MAG: ABC transporter permease [Candidatus Omnitrophica bacterium]|nr:ABC transporter permease [Candidatus Omnitrophota bacterium]